MTNQQRNETQMLDQLNDAAASLGGQWVKCKDLGDVIEGVVLDFEIRGKTFEGQPVLSRKSGEQRKEWVFTIQTDDRTDADDDGVRKFSANESAQRAIAAAIKEAGSPAKKGDRVKLGVSKAAASTTEQAEYKARWTTAAEELSIPAPAAPSEDPF